MKEMERMRKPLLTLLAQMFSSSKLGLLVDPEIAEFNAIHRKALKLAIKKGFINMSFGRDITITQRGLIYLKAGLPDVYDEMDKLTPENTEQEVLCKFWQKAGLPDIY